MAIKKYKPTTNGRRFMTATVRVETSKNTPHKPLLDDGGNVQRGCFGMCCKNRDPTYDELKGHDNKRKRLLSMARLCWPPLGLPERERPAGCHWSSAEGS